MRDVSVTMFFFFFGWGRAIGAKFLEYNWGGGYENLLQILGVGYENRY